MLATLEEHGECEVGAEQRPHAGLDGGDAQQMMVDRLYGTVLRCFELRHCALGLHRT